MSRWQIAAGLCMLSAAMAFAQTLPSSDGKSAPTDSGQESPFGLPPPFKPNPEAQPDKPKVDTQVDKSEMPPEEDKTGSPQVFTFNPVQSQHDVVIGDQYFKKGNYTAAVGRYVDATKWNDGNALAWRSLGEAEEKKSNKKAALEAYQKYLELSPDAKDAKDIKNRLAKLQR
jgi:tetratricopeptide (TPR) repeat protein